jgi:hypothetical protein
MARSKPGPGRPNICHSRAARSGTPPARVAALRTVFADLPREVRDYFQVDPELSFAIDVAWMEAKKVG